MFVSTDDRPVKKREEQEEENLSPDFVCLHACMCTSKPEKETASQD
jgi:hypothetical protein